jgi:hypothetical protein
MDKFDFKAVAAAIPNNGGTGILESENKLIIALDFGTTFSGVAFCFPKSHETKVTAVVNWPGQFLINLNLPLLKWLLYRDILTQAH